MNECVPFRPDDVVFDRTRIVIRPVVEKWRGNGVAGPCEVIVVVGSEGKGLSRLVTETCDAVVSIPISAATESLNAGIAASVTLYEISKLRAKR